MTRAELAAEKVRKAKAKREEAQRLAKEKDAALAQSERQAAAQARLEARKALTRRRYAVGDLAERAGLFAWDNTVLGDLFTLLALLVETPNPVAVLDALLGEVPESHVERLLTAQGVFSSQDCTDQGEKSLALS
jgi:hypothetical protein